MRSLNSSAFFLRWQNLYASSNPGQSKERWEVGDVEWVRDRHSFRSANYSVQFDVHRLKCRDNGKMNWQLLVVVEHWWGPDQKTSIRDRFWSRPIVGTTERILKWFDAQDELEIRRRTPKPPLVVQTADRDKR